MPEGLEKYKKYYEPKKFTSTTYVYQPYKETTYAPPPTLGQLPEYYTKKYEADPHKAIPYREVEAGEYKAQEPYQHTFPKYTKYYASTTQYYAEPSTEKAEVYTEPQGYRR